MPAYVHKMLNKNINIDRFHECFNVLVLQKIPEQTFSHSSEKANAKEFGQSAVTFCQYTMHRGIDCWAAVVFLWDIQPVCTWLLI